MQVPTIHLNGTSRSELLREAQAAHAAVEAAINAVRDMTVHGRDYYVQPRAGLASPYTIAVHEHEQRLQRLFELQNELVDYYAALAAQGER
jgi:hypothetical protein